MMSSLMWFGVFAGGPLHGIRMVIPDASSAAFIIFAAPTRTWRDWLSIRPEQPPEDVWRRFEYKAVNFAAPGIVWYEYVEPAKPITTFYERDSFTILPYATAPKRREVMP